MPTTHLLYLHGFRSSPQSAKARQLGAWVQQQHPSVVWWCPQLPPSPCEAMQMVREGVAAWPHAGMAVVGSSLGGFYATHVAHIFDCKAVLLNPAVHPARDLAKHIGVQTGWHTPGERFYFEPGFVNELRALEVRRLQQPENFLAVIAKGDEVLDWREMTGRYPGARIKLLESGDHALSDFDQHMAEITDFLMLA